MNTKQKIEVMQAFEDGKTIEYRIFGRDCWTETKEPCWNWEYCEYRVNKAPEYIVRNDAVGRPAYVEIKALEDCLELIDRVSHAKEFWNINLERYWALKELIK